MDAKPGMVTMFNVVTKDEVQFALAEPAAEDKFCNGCSMKRSASWFAIKPNIRPAQRMAVCSFCLAKLQKKRDAKRVAEKAAGEE